MLNVKRFFQLFSDNKLMSVDSDGVKIDAERVNNDNIGARGAGNGKYKVTWTMFFLHVLSKCFEDEVKIDAERVNGDSPGGRGTENGKRKLNNIVFFTFRWLF